MLIDAVDNDPNDELDEFATFITNFFLTSRKMMKTLPDSIHGYVIFLTNMMATIDPRVLIWLT